MPKEWYVAATKFNQERLAQVELRRQKFVTFLPRVRKRVGSGYVMKVYFPGYIFIRFDREKDRFGVINSTRGVTRLFACGEVPSRIRRGVIEKMIAAAVDDDFMEDDKIHEIIFEVGQKIKIKSGLFSGMYGMVKLSSHEAVSVLLDTPASNSRMKIKPMDFEPGAIEAV